MIYHCCVDVSGALKSNRRLLAKMFRDETGRRLSADEAHEALCEHLRQGHEVIPVGKPCEGFSYITGCPGHADKPLTEPTAMLEASL